MKNIQVNDRLHHHYCKGDRIMLTVLWSHLLFALLLSRWYETMAEALLIGVPAALIPTVLNRLRPGGRLTRVAVGVAFMVFSALAIHQGNGMIELHFGIFTLLAFLLYYHDWLPIVSAAVVIAVHHFSFYFMQINGMPVYLFPEAAIELVFVHATYVVFEVVVLLYLAHLLHCKVSEGNEVMSLVSAMEGVNGSIDLTRGSETQYGYMANMLDSARAAINGVLVSVICTSRNLTDTSGKLARLSQETSEGMKCQLMETTQIAAAVTQMSVSSQAVAVSAREAFNASQSADENAQLGSKLMFESEQSMGRLASEIERAAETVARLDKASEQIGGVVSVIKSIAEQTNLLALNAAIEAARAGNQGRGFAVVAEEVRTLASRTKNSTGEIEKMIESVQSATKLAVNAMKCSQEETDSSETHVKLAVDALHSITKSVATISDMNLRISIATQEQSIAAESISVSIASISEVAENTSHGSQQASSVVSELTAAVSELDAQVSCFRL